MNQADLIAIAAKLKSTARDYGFQQLAITDTELTVAGRQLCEWLEQGLHGEMAYMASHGSKRYRPAENIPGTVRVLSVRMDYFPPGIRQAEDVLHDPHAAYISRYALGRDYHKLLRKRLVGLAERLAELAGPHQYRVFVDSAPVMEKPLAAKAGLGWQGKHTNLLSRDAGSWFFLGEIYTDLPLPIDQPGSNHCGDCTRCLDICPTQAIIAPYRLDARRCISYLTIELAGSIPVSLRKGIGNRIYGCDDCQLVCPWNRFARHTAETDFSARHQLDDISLMTLFCWDEAEFLHKTEGTAIRRINHHRWLRNIAVALGNAPPSADITRLLTSRLDHPSAMVREHIQWALAEQERAG